MILTIGMGVDSNVLIFERIREELRAGKAPAAAVASGLRACVDDDHRYPRDDHCFGGDLVPVFGTGPVRGFAVTLTFGLLANIFTAVFVSRVIFDANLQRMQRGAELSI